MKSQWIRDQLKPLFARRFSKSWALALRELTDANFTEKQERAFLAGFKSGYVYGANDASFIDPQDLLSAEATEVCTGRD